MTRPPNRFLFGRWAYAGRLNRDIGKLPGFGRLPRPPCAARTLDDRDGIIISGFERPGTREDAANAISGKKRHSAHGFAASRTQEFSVG
jgi:hypothetical protein